MGEIIITSSVLIIVLVLLRRICWGKISRRLQYGLWILVAVRLLMPPELFTSPFSVMNIVVPVKEAVSEMEQVGENTGEKLSQEVQEDFRESEGEIEEQEFQKDHTNLPNENDMTVLPENSSQFPVTQAEGKKDTGKSISMETILSLVYVIGVIGVGGCIVICNLKFRRKLSKERVLIGREGRLKVYLVPHLESPCLCGVLAPAIYINERGNAESLRKTHIIQHETTHFLHFDHIWAVVRSLCITFYWFDPLVWVAAVLSMQDSELACDEGTLRRLGVEHRQEYGRTLIEMTADKVGVDRIMYSTTGMTNGKEEIKKRIRAIAEYKKQMIWGSVAAVAFALLLLACTAGVRNEDPDIPEVPHSSDSLQESTQEMEDRDMEESLLKREDGSYRLSEYCVDLTGDKLEEKIVFDVSYWTDPGAEQEITRELLWQKLWDGTEISVKILEGCLQDTGDGEVLVQEELLEEYFFSSAHARNGNLAVMNFERQMCVLLYGNEVYQDSGKFWYQVWQIMPAGEEPVLREEKSVAYVTPELGTNEQEVYELLTEVEDRLDWFFLLPSTRVLLSASVNRDVCYLYDAGGEQDERGERPYAMDVFYAEVETTGLELKIQDYFYPDGMESLTRLPEDAEARILAGEILCMEVSPENNTAGRLDVDGDGVREVLYLDSMGHSIREDGWRDSGVMGIRYRLRVDEYYYEGYCSRMDPVVMAYSPDGENILLALYDDGPSGDPETLFFSCDGSGVYPAGRITDDLRSVTIDKERMICGTFRADMLRTEYVQCYHYWDGSRIVQREDEIYYFTAYDKEPKEYPLDLLTEITVHKERTEDSSAITVKPQKVIAAATDMKEWVLLEAEDGTKGWIRVNNQEIPSMGDKKVYEVFEGAYFVD